MNYLLLVPGVIGGTWNVRDPNGTIVYRAKTYNAARLWANQRTYCVMELGQNGEVR